VAEFLSNGVDFFSSVVGQVAGFRAVKVLFSWKYLFFFLFSLAGWLILYRNRAMKGARIAAQVLAFLLFGGVLGLVFTTLQQPFGLHPSPMCSVTKGIAIPIIYHKIAIPQLMLVLTAVVLTLVGAKAFCGWVCPIGALQELVHRIPGLKRVRVSFLLSNIIRVALFALFLQVAFIWKELSYDYFNPFELLHWHDMGALMVWGPALAVLAASLFIYRPFCSFVCPLGLITWLAELVAPGRIRVSSACTNCGSCIAATSCQTMPALVERSKTPPDCFACGDCLDTCPEDAISFGWKKKD